MKYTLSPHTFITENVAYVAMPMPADFEAGILVNGLMSDFIDELFEQGDVQAVQVAFLSPRETCILGFTGDDYSSILDDMDLADEHQAVNLTLNHLDKLDAHYLHLKGLTRSGEHLYAVVCEYMMAIEEGHPEPKELAGLKVLRARIDRDEIRQDIEPRAGMQA